MAPKRTGSSSTQTRAAKKKKIEPSTSTVNSVKALFQNAQTRKKADHSLTVALLGFQGSSTAQVWTTKYAPNVRKELAVHKKKVQVCYRLPMTSGPCRHAQCQRLQLVHSRAEQRVTCGYEGYYRARTFT